MFSSSLRGFSKTLIEKTLIDKSWINPIGVASVAAPILSQQSHLHSYMPTEFMSDFLGGGNPVETSIREKLAAALNPEVLQVINESHMHAVPKNSETHFKVVVVSECFEGVKAIDRHRKVNSILSGELGSGSGGGGVHALSIVAKTPKQWHESGENAGKSPPCRGGMGL